MALTRFKQTDNGTQGGGLTGAIGADQGYYFTLLNGQRDPFKGMDVPVIRVNILDF
jgi:hypothetical protein